MLPLLLGLPVQGLVESVAAAINDLPVSTTCFNNQMAAASAVEAPHPSAEEALIANRTQWNRRQLRLLPARLWAPQDPTKINLAADQVVAALLI